MGCWWQFDSMSVLHPGDEFEVRARRNLLNPGWKVGSITTWVEVGDAPLQLRCDLWSRSVREPRRIVAKPVPRRMTISAAGGGSLTKYGYPEEVARRAQSVVDRFETGAVEHAEARLARLTLSLLDDLDGKRLERETADQVFALLFLYLTDDDREGVADRGELSDEVKDLVLEANILGHYGGKLGPDPAYLRGLAKKILARTGHLELDAVPSSLEQAHKVPGGPTDEPTPRD